MPIASFGPAIINWASSEMKSFSDVFPADNIHHHFVGQDQAKGVYAKELHIPAGFRMVSHKHLYDHLSILASGRVCLSINGDHQYLSGPYALTIAAGTEHTLRAVTDAVWFCVHPTDCDDPAKVDETLIAKETV